MPSQQKMDRSVEMPDCENPMRGGVSKSKDSNKKTLRASQKSPEKVSSLYSKADYPDFWSSANCCAPFVQEPGLVLDNITKQEHTAFFDEETDKIFTYNGDMIRQLLVPFLSADMSVCYSNSMWFRHLGYVTYAIVLMVYLAEVWYPDTEMGEVGAPIGACPKDSPINKNMCAFEDTMSFAKGEFRFLIAFILAGYVASAVGRWKEVRTDYASLCGNTRNLILNINSILPQTSKIEDDCRGTATRWALCAYELAVLKSRGHMDSPQGRQYLEENGDLQPGEWDVLAPGDRHTAVLFWLQTLITELVHAEDLEGEMALKLCEDISSFRAKANDMMSSLNRDRPFPYVALCGLLVKLNVFIFSTWKAIEWSAWLKTFGYAGLFGGQIRIWADFLVLFVWNVSYMGLYDLGYYLNNPFGNRRIDVPHEAISGGLHRLGKYCSKINNEMLPPCLMKRKVGMK